MHVAIGQQSDAGKVRKRNEDAALVRSLADGAAHLLLVADGIGGGRRGDEASALASRVMDARVQAALPDAEGFSDEHVSSVLRAALEEANSAVRALFTVDSGRSGMGTTCVAAIVSDGRCVLRHVGDSRAYLLRDRRFAQVTQDHAAMQEIRRSGPGVHRESSGSHIHLVMTRAIGMEKAVESDERRLDLIDGDTLLLCTDGLNTMLSDADIEAVLARVPEPQAAADRLVAEANARGGVDNTTVVVMRVGEFQTYEPARLTSHEPLGGARHARADEWEDDGDEVPGDVPAAPAARSRRRPSGVHPGYLVAALAVGVLLGYLLRGLVGPQGGDAVEPSQTLGGQRE